MDLISCVMATANRGPFVRQALRAFAAQSYPERELIVVDDGESPVGKLCRGQPKVRYIRLPDYTTTGAKLNIGIEAARGRWIQKLDDDDYYAPGFLANQMRHMPARGCTSSLVTRCCFLIALRGDACVRHSGHGWRPGGAFFFHRHLWRRRPFRELRKSSDTWFLADHDPRCIRVCAAEEYLVVRHGANTWNMMTTCRVDRHFAQCAPYPKALRQLVPPLLHRFYRSALLLPG